jgi:hypothetical protein
MDIYEHEGMDGCVGTIVSIVIVLICLGAVLLAYVFLLEPGL